MIAKDKAPNKINDDLMKKILSTKTELEFMKVVFSENIPKDLWEKYPQINEHFEKIRYRLKLVAEHNVGFLRKKSDKV